MAQIHPSAIIDPCVELAADAVVGPGCIIEGPVRIGPGTRLMAQVFLQGPLTLGEQNHLYPGACLGYPPQDRRVDPATHGAGTVIGDRNVFRESVTIHRATGDEPTRIGDDNYFMVNTHVGHDCRVGHRCTLANGAVLGGHISLADDVFLGGNSGIHQFCRVGRLAMLGGGTGITQDLPPFCVARVTREVCGLNLVGLRRAGLRQHIEPLKQAFAILYRQGHARTGALAQIREQLGHDPLCLELTDFVAGATRGITSYGRGATACEG